MVLVIIAIASLLLVPIAFLVGFMTAHRFHTWYFKNVKTAVLETEITQQKASTNRNTFDTVISAMKANEAHRQPESGNPLGAPPLTPEQAELEKSWERSERRSRSETP